MALFSKIHLFAFLFGFCHAEMNSINSEEFTITIHLVCQNSDELKAFKSAIPNSQGQNADYSEFKDSITKSLTALITLVDSEKVQEANWSIELKDN